MPTNPKRLAVAALVASLATSACISTQSYLDVAGPRYAGSATSEVPDRLLPGEVRIGSFNLQYGAEVQGALEVIQEDAGLRQADILLLQEMDSEGTARLAEALDMHWVYYPAILMEGREFGNAILSRWPIQDDEKVVLPHGSIYGDTRRAATVATVEIDGVPVRVYSVHLATPVNMSRERREDQWWAVLDDAATHPYVVIGGDLNSHSIADLALDRGFHWATREGPRTTWWARVDHILYKGLVPTWSSSDGTVAEETIDGVSDHRPVWTRARLRADVVNPDPS